MADQTPILHHYDASPFSWKARALLGLKGVAWRSVVTPNMLPKPDLVPLTGGYRRAPVLQIGADVYLDSALILAEIERRWPGHATPGAWPINLWADRAFFGASVIVIFGSLGDRIDPAFAADRTQLSGRPFDAAAMKLALPGARAAWRAHAAWIEDALVAADAPFLAGTAASIADIAAYMNVWFVAGVLPHEADALLAGFMRLAAWRRAVAALGGGARSELTGAEALAIAAANDPAPLPYTSDAADPLGLAIGDPVTIAADDYGRDPIAGTLVALDPHRVTIAREVDGLGTLHVHAPRLGYVIALA